MCLCLLSAGIKGLCYCTGPLFLFLARNLEKTTENKIEKTVLLITQCVTHYAIMSLQVILPDPETRAEGQWLRETSLINSTSIKFRTHFNPSFSELLLFWCSAGTLPSYQDLNSCLVRFACAGSHSLFPCISIATDHQDIGKLLNYPTIFKSYCYSLWFIMCLVSPMS